MKLAFYGRYSSNHQREESIEGQLKVCNDYVKSHGHEIIKRYEDREFTGTNDRRPDFQRMVEDAQKGEFEGVIVYRFDRFARKGYDTYFYKKKLEDCGVKVISALETVSDDTSSILVEGIFIALAEYYSAELGQKIQRGMNSNAEKGLYNGGYVFLGYKIEENEHKQKKYVIDENTAYIVRDIFNMYNNEHTMQEIADYLNNKGLRTTQGNIFRKSTISTILKNKRYTGVYMYKDVEIEGGMPRIIEDDVFNKAQVKLDSIRKAPAKAKAKEEFLLTSKLYCGHCKELMSGTSGTSQTGILYRYYVCNGVKQKKCNKKRVPKNQIEDLVFAEIKQILTKKNIKKIANQVGKLFKQKEENIRLTLLQNELKKNEQKQKKILNRTIECDDENIRKAFYEELKKLDIAKVNIEKEIEEEKEKYFSLTEDDIITFFEEIKNGNLNDTKHKRILINALVDRIYLYDDYMSIVFFAYGKKFVVDKKLIEYAESSFLEQLAQPIRKFYLKGCPFKCNF